MPWENTIVFSLYLLIFALLSFPLVFNLGEAILGQGPDPYQYIWNAFVFRHEAVSLSDPFYTNLVNFPDGVSLWMHTYTPVIGVINLIFNHPYLSVNLALLLSFTLSGFGAYLLSLRFLENKVFAFICGFVFAFSPYKTSHLLEHYHLLLTAGVPFFVLAILRITPKFELSSISIKWKYLVTAIICGAVTLFSDYYTVFFLFFFAAFFLLFVLFYSKWSNLKQYQKVLMLVLLFIAGHLIVEPMYVGQMDDRGAFFNTSDISAIGLPAENSFLYDFVFFEQWRARTNFKGPNEQVIFLGFAMIFLLLLGKGRSKDRKYAFLVFFCVVFFLLSLPKLKFLGKPISYSPTAWFHYIPFLNNIRNPSRFIGMFYLFFPILVFARVEARNLKMRSWVPLIILLVIVLEYWPKKYPFIHTNETAEYASFIHAEKDIKVLWHIPSGVSDGFQEVGIFEVKRLQDQISHQKSIVGAYVSRLPQETFQVFQNEQIFKILNDIALGRKIMHDLDIPMETINSFLSRYQLDLIILPKENKELQIIVERLFKNHIDRQRSEAVNLKDFQLVYLVNTTSDQWSEDL